MEFKKEDRMPVKITAYECVHGCGKYLKTKKIDTIPYKG